MDYRPTEILDKYWGYDAFRPLQAEIIDTVLQGDDTIALLPTGGGKSICFQVPILCHAKGIAIVISPLIALMEDQVNQLKARDIKAIALTSKLTKRALSLELDNIINGAYRFVYLSPERLSSQRIQESITYWNVRYIAVDEAHCISQWGFDFRPSYLHINEHIQHLDKPVIAVTATATPQVLEDIKSSLEFDRATLFSKSFQRDNISITIQHSEQKLEDVIHILNHVEGSAILYLRNRLGVEKYTKQLKARGISVDFYHAGLSTERRETAQKKWIENEIRLIVCTNAFGMGIDKPDVRLVFHLDTTPSIEEYYQEIGRAGRDSQKSYAVSLLNQLDLEKSMETLEYHKLDTKEMFHVYDYLMRLNDIAIQDGLERVFQIDVDLLISKFNIKVSRLEKILEAIQRMGLWELSSQFEASSSIRVTATTAWIRNQKKDSLSDRLIQYLLRRYQNVLHTHVKIEESQIAKVIDIHKEKLYSLLQNMEAKDLISYHPKSNKPKVYLVLDRVRQDVFLKMAKQISESHRQKKDRLRSMHRVINSQDCRQQIILSYFKEEIPPCGKCDNCLIQGLSDQQKNRLKSKIEQKLQQGVSPTRILRSIPLNKRRLAMTILKSS